MLSHGASGPLRGRCSTKRGRSTWRRLTRARSALSPRRGCASSPRAHADPFADPGNQDITAHVDFSALAKAASEAGLEVLGYTTQAQFLINCGITEVLAETNIEQALHYAPLAAEAQKLLSPAEMGELFKVLAVGRGIERPVLGFSRGDR